MSARTSILAVAVLAIAACDDPAAPVVEELPASLAAAQQFVASAEFQELERLAERFAAGGDPRSLQAAAGRIGSLIPTEADDPWCNIVGASRNGSEAKACFWENAQFIASTAALAGASAACAGGALLACLAIPSATLAVRRAALDLHECYCEADLAYRRYCD